MPNSITQEEKVRENKLRRAATRQGLRLEKSRRRDPRSIDYGRYWLIDGPASSGENWRARVAVLGGEHGATLDEIEAALNER